MLSTTLVAIVPSAGALFLFWIAIRAIVQADRRERIAQARIEAAEEAAAAAAAAAGSGGATDVQDTQDAQDVQDAGIGGSGARGAASRDAEPGAR